MSKPNTISQENIIDIAGLMINRLGILTYQLNPKEDFIEHYNVNGDQFSIIIVTSFERIQAEIFLNISNKNESLSEININLKDQYEIHKIFAQETNSSVGTCDYNTRIGIVL